MAVLANGKYRTKHGSTVTVSGKHSGRFDIDFDWLEEEGACIDCHPSVGDDGRLVWDCEYHESGSADLIVCEPLEIGD